MHPSAKSIQLRTSFIYPGSVSSGDSGSSGSGSGTDGGGAGVDFSTMLNFLLYECLRKRQNVQLKKVVCAISKFSE